MGKTIDFFLGLLFCIVLWTVVRIYFKIPADLGVKLVFLLLFFIVLVSYAEESYKENNGSAVAVVQILIAVGITITLVSHLVFIPETDSSAVSGTSETDSSNIQVSPVTNPSDMTVTPQSALTINQDPISVGTSPTQIEYYTRNYHWTYGGQSSIYTLNIPKPLYDYYRHQSHSRTDYSQYALTATDKKLLDSMISNFKEHFNSKDDSANNVVAFVQSLPYFYDNASTGYDNYPRYPIETLVDNGGDCEDTAILTAALLKEMNYDVVLLSPPGHVAVGITCTGCTGKSITYNNKKYYYLETTGNNWKVGQMPQEYNNAKFRVYPM